jgi:hypothetical protein
MIFSLKQWLEKRRRLRQLWKSDAQTLIERDEPNAYYTAQRLAARLRATGDQSGFFHWTKVAAEVARRSSVAEMDISVVEEIASDEFKKSRTRESSASDPS